jgi:hypothetical protein
MVNPDGVDLVQQGGNRPYLQRKNLDNAGGARCANPPTGSNQGGVDLNRNTVTHWDTTGISHSPCSQTYNGQTADSEPETKAVEGLFRKLFGNDAALRKIAATMSSYNGYRYGQPGEILYNASGTSDDWSYGELGIASFTIEAASCGSFTPSYSCVTTDYAKNLPALMYVAKVANAPYRS